jgi:ethanolamine ammonia-lyase small subunit
MSNYKPPAELDRFWALMRSVTTARIGLSRTGSGVATREQLAFQLAHAEAQDAVHKKFDAAHLRDALAERNLESIYLNSMVSDRHTYIRRPDLGRSLSDKSRDLLSTMPRGYDLVVVIADGLSARAIAEHALPLLDEAIPLLKLDRWRIGPIAIVEQGRVAIGDEIGQILEASMVAMLIGERPGLTSPNSLGVYLTWSPEVGRTDAERNCLSNIRPEGMSYGEAATRMLYLCNEARRRKLTGVLLKDETRSHTHKKIERSRYRGVTARSRKEPPA